MAIPDNLSSALAILDLEAHCRSVHGIEIMYFEIVYFERFLRKACRSFLTLRAGLTVWVKKSKVHASLLIKPGIPCNYSRGTMNMGSFSRILLAIMCLFDRFNSS